MEKNNNNNYKNSPNLHKEPSLAFGGGDDDVDEDDIPSTIVATSDPTVSDLSISNLSVSDQRTEDRHYMNNRRTTEDNVSLEFAINDNGPNYKSQVTSRQSNNQRIENEQQKGNVSRCYPANNVARAVPVPPCLQQRVRIDIDNTLRSDDNQDIINQQIQSKNRNNDVVVDHIEILEATPVESILSVSVRAILENSTHKCMWNTRSFTLLMVFLLASVIVAVTIFFSNFCGEGSCLGESSSSNSTSSIKSMTNESSIIVPGNDLVTNNIKKYIPFQSTEELYSAVDEYITGVNLQALEENYGPIEQWQVSAITDFKSLFDGRFYFNADISRWNVSQATNMMWMFRDAYQFSADISNWDVTNVIYMKGFMENARSFDANLSLWNTAKVINMASMFYSADSFTGTGLEHWNVSNVVDMQELFAGAKLFNGNLSKWDVSTVQDMSYMFYYAISYTGDGIEQWNTSSVTDMESMFESTDKFDANLSSWDVSNVKTAEYMFKDAKKFQGVGLNQWNDFHFYATAMFCGANKLNKSYISTWDVSLNGAFICNEL